MLRKLADQVVVITGASSGIGRCAALLFASRGAKVVITSRRSEALEALAAEIGRLGGAAVAVAGDVTSKADLDRVGDAAIEHFGRIDTWINDAGVYLQARVEDITLDEYRRVVDVNFVGTVNGTQCALERMLGRGDGVIIQVSSVASKRGVPYTTAYSASKAAIDAFTVALRAELWGRGIRFSILYPQTVDTPIYNHGRGKLGVMPKPAPPVADPLEAAEALAHLAETGERHAYLGWSRALQLLSYLVPSAGDWLLHRVKPMTFSDRAAAPDNIDRPSPDAPRIRGGWSDKGWRGLTLDEVVQTFPLESAALSAIAGLLAARMVRSVARRTRGEPRVKDLVQ
jgi:NAD(P)-dependent dehydrogenase (short-subunit alcohol dehydrogenase family)